MKRQNGWFLFSRVMFFFYGAFVLLAGSVNVSAQSALAENYAVQIGVLSNRIAAEGSLGWAQVARGLQEAIPGCTFEIVPCSREQMMARVYQNAIDFIAVDPVLLAQLKARYEVEIMATRQSSFKGVDYALSGGALFCLSQKSGITRPEDLKGRSIAVADKTTLPGWLAVVREFRRIGLRPDQDLKTTVLGRDENVVTAVLQGEVEAGCVQAGAIERVLAERNLDQGTFRMIEFKDIRDPNPWIRIPVAVSTRLYPDISFVACPRAAPGLVKKVAVALLSMSLQNPGTADRPQVVGWTFPKSDLAVHECLQELRLPPYEQFGKTTFEQVVHQYIWLIGAGGLILILLLITFYVNFGNLSFVQAIRLNTTEIALRESVARFEHIAACSADWIWETDASNRFTYSSSIVETMLGYREEELVGKTHYDLLATVEKERLAALGQKSLGMGARIFRERFQLLTKNGRVVIHEMTAEPILDSKGQFAGYRGVSRDITNQVRFVKLRP